MERRNTLLLTIIAIATLLVAVVGATFAYVASGTIANNDATTNKENANFNRGTAKFLAPGTAMIINVSPESMIATEPGQVYGTSQGSFDVVYNAAGSRENYCKYDVYFKWTSSDKYTAHSKYMENDMYLDNTGKEFTVTVSSVVGNHTGDGITGTQFIDEIANDTNHEVDFADLKDCDTPQGCKIASGVVYSNTNVEDKATVVTWNFKTTMYNLDHNQNDPVYGLAGKTYTGEFYVTNIEC